MTGEGDLLLYKNNTDNKGASYGAHENYLVRRSTPFGDIVRHLTPFFVSRQVVCGAGRVGLGQDGHGDGFQISQRADYFEVEVGLETTLKRPIINTRDEPHADPEKYRRLHVILGDANLSEISTYLKVGTTALVLTMIEDRFLTADLSVARPVASLKHVSHDPSLTHLLEVGDGRTMTAVELQWEYFHLAQRYIAERRGGETDDATRDVLARWESVLTRLERDPFECADELDWVAKLKLLNSYRDRDGLAWSDAKLHLIDLQYADLRPEKGLYHRLLKLGRMKTPRRCRGRRGRDARAAGGHPGLLPRPVPEQVQRQHRSRVVGLGDLRPPGPRVAAASAHDRPAARQQGPRRRATRPARHGGRPVRGAYPPLRLQRTWRPGARDERWRHVLTKDLLWARAVATLRMSCICSSLLNAAFDQLAEPLRVSAV